MSSSEVPDLIELPKVLARSTISCNISTDTQASDATAVNSDSSDEDEGEQSGNNFLDDDGDEILQPEFVSCFFCRREPGTPQDVLDHCTSDHDCNLVAWVKNRKLPTEDIIKMVNFIRKTHPDPAAFSERPFGAKNSIPTDPSLWAADEFMLQVCPEDHGITSLLIWDWSEPDLPAEPFPAPVSKKSMAELFQDGDHEEESPESHDKDNARNADYFDSYGGSNIHCEMLRDKVRTESYQNAIAAMAKGKIVLDIGCGSGVLSCFAALAGAKQVVAVDKADIIEHAHDIARTNGLDGKINFVHGDLDRVKLPVDQVDLIVSEWMGYFLLFEGMLDSVISARDKYLSPTGTMIPSTANLFITALSDQEDWKTSVGFWNDAYGLKFECLRRHTLRFPSVHAVDAACVVAETVTLRSFDLMTCRVGDLDFSTETVFTPTKSCNLTALVGFFDVGYNLDENNHKVMFCTSPADPTTHWAQSVFYLDQVFPVKGGFPVTLFADVRKSRDDKRGLTVSLQMSNSDGLSWKQTYEL